MRTYLARFSLIVLAWLILSSFRIAPEMRTADLPIMYDVRGAFVSAPPSVSRTLVAETGNMVDAAIRATFRKTLLPRTILTIRILATNRTTYVVGTRYSATISVDATAVGNGEKVATGRFEVSAFNFNDSHSDVALARKIAERLAEEFRLEDSAPSTLATALFP